MSIRREGPVTERLLALLRSHPGPDPASTGAMDEPIAPHATLTRRQAVALFESATQSRLQDLLSRELKDKGISYYTIGSSGHESNAIFGELLRTTDTAFLHYRSGAFMAARLRKGRGETPFFDAMLSFCASAEDPISGGRHKVLGSPTLHVPPQTSTIASHLPKAVGYAMALQKLERQGIPVRGGAPWDSVVYCSFGDASMNHATAQAGFHAAGAAVLHNQPCPILFACEDNGIGISVRTPETFVARMMQGRPGIRYFACDSQDYPGVWATAQAAIEFVREHRRPAFVHTKTVRLMGHAGSDVEGNYLTLAQIEANEQRDPLLGFADLLLRSGAIGRDAILRLYQDTDERLRRAAAEAATRRKLVTVAEIVQPLVRPQAGQCEGKVADPATRLAVFGGKLPEDDPRPRHLAFRIPQALTDLLAAYPHGFLFGEDVAKKGGVYNATTGLCETFGPGRVFNTILDETTILGLAQGMAQAGCLAFPEIQYLAYIHNALDQIRGEAASLQFFSTGRPDRSRPGQTASYSNPMVVRIAGLAYQKGFGGHFHNDNSVGALLDIPGIVLGVPTRADDAVLMLRTMAAAAQEHGMVCLFLEPIALYMQKDLHAPNDGLWQFPYPPPHELMRIGEGRVHEATDDDDLTIVTFGNGVWMSLRVQKQLRARGIKARVFDLRWLMPLPIAQIKEHVRATGRCLVVDECRATHGGPSPMILTELCQDPELAGCVLRRVAAVDTYVPLAAAANLVLVQEADIEKAAIAMCTEQVR
ncbi:MAG: thiamine pyrophosphate-dependent enzyme [Planctomycetota bacterium]|nr:thiamine pyrophosphate-dependent enzyme [Planctomycetota bacterium]